MPKRCGIDGLCRRSYKRHLHCYLSEFDFRYNARKIKDGERTFLTVKGADRKRLKLGTQRSKMTKARWQASFRRN